MRYNQAFKQMAIELYDSGKSSEQIGEELGLGHDTVRRWKNKQSIGSNPEKSTEQQEIDRLRRALREAELEREILKKALSIFSKTGGKSSGL